MPANWHVLLKGELTDAPGRMESYTVSVSPRARGRWLLSSVGTDFSGGQPGEGYAEQLSTRRLIEWVLERDAEIAEETRRRGFSRGDSTNDAEQETDDAPGRSFGPVAARLREIAENAQARYCVRLLDSWVASRWPRPATPPRVLAIVGPKKRQVWRGIFHSVLAVSTDRGAAYMYAPTGAYAMLCFEGEMTGQEVRLPRRLQEEAKRVLAAGQS